MTDPDFLSQSELETPLAREILAGRFAAKDTIRVEVRGGQFEFTRDEAAGIA